MNLILVAQISGMCINFAVLGAVLSGLILTKRAERHVQDQLQAIHEAFLLMDVGAHDEAIELLREYDIRCRIRLVEKHG